MQKTRRLLFIAVGAGTRISSGAVGHAVALWRWMQPRILTHIARDAMLIQQNVAISVMEVAYIRTTDRAEVNDRHASPPNSAGRGASLAHQINRLIMPAGVRDLVLHLLSPRFFCVTLDSLIVHHST